MSHGTNILFNISLFKLSELSPSWVLNVTEILESLLEQILLTLAKVDKSGGGCGEGGDRADFIVGI